jgi:hypothetical protein
MNLRDSDLMIHILVYFHVGLTLPYPYVRLRVLPPSKYPL